MTFPKLSAAHKHTIYTCTKGFDDKERVHSAGTHDPNDPEIGRVLKPGNTCRVGRGVAAPIAKETQYLRFKRFVVCHLSIAEAFSLTNLALHRP
jgi:hypothetical protein